MPTVDNISVVHLKTCLEGISCQVFLPLKKEQREKYQGHEKRATIDGGGIDRVELGTE